MTSDIPVVYVAETWSSPEEALTLVYLGGALRMPDKYARFLGLKSVIGPLDSSKWPHEGVPEWGLLNINLRHSGLPLTFLTEIPTINFKCKEIVLQRLQERQARPETVLPLAARAVPSLVYRPVRFDFARISRRGSTHSPKACQARARPTRARFS